MTKALPYEAQAQIYNDYVYDDRPVVATGWEGVDSLLHRGGLAPGTLALLGGRTRTRKTTVMLNLIANMLSDEVSVGLVGLDEAKHSYIGKLISALNQQALPKVEEWWQDEGYQYGPGVLDKLVMYNGYRPTFPDLTEWMMEAELLGKRPQVVFIDYTSLLGRGKFDGAEQQRMARLIENLQVWTNEQGVATIGLHQVGRLDEGVGQRYHGDTPMSLEGLKYAGEEVADLVLATYRPALDPVGNMSWEMAQAFKGDKFEYEDWEKARTRVVENQNITYLQLLKNRPGTKVDEQGIPLESIGESMAMRPAARERDESAIRAFG